MTTSELLLQDYDIEIAMTRRVLERIPEGNPEYKCHDKSMPLGRLAVHVATLPNFGNQILTTPSMDLATVRWPDMTFVSRDAVLATFDERAAETRASLAAASDAEL